MRYSRWPAWLENMTCLMVLEVGLSHQDSGLSVLSNPDVNLLEGYSEFDLKEGHLGLVTTAVSAVLNALRFGVRGEGVGLDGDCSVFSGRRRRRKVRWDIGAFARGQRRDGRLPGRRSAILLILLLLHSQRVIKTVLEAKVGGQRLHWV